MGASFGGWIAAELATMQPGRLRRLVLVAAAGVKTGSRDELDIPDIFAQPADAVQRMLYVQPDKFRADPAAMTDEELRIMLRNRESLALLARGSRISQSQAATSPAPRDLSHAVPARRTRWSDRG